MSRRSRSTWLAGVAWAPHRLDLVQSPAWRLAPVPLCRILGLLEIEHMRHGGKLNGELFVSHRQFTAAGISRRKITVTMTLGEELGLLDIVKPDQPIGDLRAAHSYRLTYIPAKGATSPTDEWKKVTEERAKALVAAYHSIERAAVQIKLRRAA